MNYIHEKTIQQTVEKLINGEDYRQEIINIINRNFFDFSISFFKKIIDAKYKSKNIDYKWYKDNFINNMKIPVQDVAIYSGTNKKTITNIYKKSTKEFIFNIANQNFDYLINMINSLEELESNFGIILKLSYNNIQVELSLTESLIVINALATKKIALRGSYWSSIGKRVEKPLMLKLCELCKVPKDFINKENFIKKKEVDREVDFKLYSKERKEYKCEVKLMGKGNPESADVIIARDTNILIADTLSNQNKLQLSSLNCLWIELKDHSQEDILYQFITILNKLDIPHS